MRPKMTAANRAPEFADITAKDLDEYLFPPHGVDVQNLTVAQATALFKQLKEILK